MAHHLGRTTCADVIEMIEDFFFFFWTEEELWENEMKRPGVGADI